MYAEAILKKGEGRTLKSGGAWVYDNEIDRVEGDYENGDILAVKDFDGFFLGWGFINTRSKITIRVMSRRKEHEITEEFLEKRVRNAWEYRKATVDTGCCRLIFGEADWLPGLVVDKFSDVLVVESLALGIDRLKPTILSLVKKVLAEDGIMIVVVALDSISGQIASGPDLVSRGFVYVKESDALMDEARDLMENVMEGCVSRGCTDWGRIKTAIKDNLGDFIWKKTKRRPMILPIIMEV